MRPCLSLPTSIFFCRIKLVTWHDICPLWIDKTFAALLRFFLLLRAQIVAPVISVFVLGCWGGGGRHSLICPKQVRASEQGMVFRVLNLKQGKKYYFTVHLLEQDAFWLAWQPLKEYEGWLWVISICGTSSFVPKRSNSVMLEWKIT